jgi:hypothetical protein
VTPLLTIVLPLSCLITVTWLSLLSWMRSTQDLIAVQSRLREEQLQLLQDHLIQAETKLEQTLEEQLQAAALQQRALLLEALRPVAAAMHRQDSLRSSQQAEVTELLLEVLNSLQPTASQQIGPLLQTTSSPSLVS